MKSRPSHPLAAIALALALAAGCYFALATLGLIGAMIFGGFRL